MTIVQGSDYYVQHFRFTGELAPRGPRLGHEFLTVRLASSGKTYVLDPAGAQFGQFRAVSSPAQRVQYMIRNVEERSHGSSKAYTTGLRAGDQDDILSPSTDFRTYHVQEAMRQVLDPAIEKWEQSHNTLDQMLRKGREAFAAEASSLTSFIRAALQKFVADYNSGAITVTIPRRHQPAPDQFRVRETTVIQHGGVDPADIVGTPEFFARLEAQGCDIFYV